MDRSSPLSYRHPDQSLLGTLLEASGEKLLCSETVKSKVSITRSILNWTCVSGVFGETGVPACFKLTSVTPRLCLRDVIQRSIVFPAGEGGAAKRLSNNVISLVKDPEPSAHWALIKDYCLAQNPTYKHDETPATNIMISLLFFIPTASIHGWQPCRLA